MSYGVFIEANFFLAQGVHLKNRIHPALPEKQP